MKLLKGTTSLFAVFMGFLVGAILVAIIGVTTPNVEFFTLFQKFYEATIQGIFTGDLYNTGGWLMTTSILVLTGLSVAFAYKAKIFNIGAEGQFVVGAFVSAVVGAYVTLPVGIHAIVALTAGIIAGGLYGLIPGVLKAYYRVSEVVVTIMLNWIAVYYTSYLVANVFTGEHTNQTPTIQDSAAITSQALSNVFDGARMHYGFIIAIAALVFYYVVLNKTTYGYELRAVGYNNDAANYAGIKSKRKILSTLIISGAFAGAAGAIYSLGAVDYFTATTSFRNYGFDGITVAFLGQMGSVGIMLSALLLAGFRTTAGLFVEVPKEIIDIIIGIILIFSVLGTVILDKIVRGRR